MRQFCNFFTLFAFKNVSLVNKKTLRSFLSLFLFSSAVFAAAFVDRETAAQEDAPLAVTAIRRMVGAEYSGQVTLMFQGFFAEYGDNISSYIDGINDYLYRFPDCDVSVDFRKLGFNAKSVFLLFLYLRVESEKHATRHFS